MEVAAQFQTTVAIHVKPDAKGKVTNRKTETDAILVKRTEGATYASTLRSVRDEELTKGPLEW